MKSTDALGDLRQLKRPLIETREAAVRLGVSISRASHLLHGLDQAGLAARIRPGLWTLETEIDPLRVPPYLTAPYPAYISFWSALARHGMIEQVPRQIFVASLDRTRRITTTLGTYSIHHLAPEVFGGYVRSAEDKYVASPEKALFDTVYVLVQRGGDVFLPEVELPKGFRADELEGWLARVRRPRLRTLVSRGLSRALSAAG